MLWSARLSSESPKLFHRWLASKPLSFWIMSWFLVELTILTVVGTFFRGPDGVGCCRGKANRRMDSLSGR